MRWSATEAYLSGKLDPKASAGNYLFASKKNHLFNCQVTKRVVDANKIWTHSFPQNLEYKLYFMQHSKERLEAFSDAVFAFAATLIVVSFEVPKEFEVLEDMIYGFASFGISFLALVLIWKVHYDYFRKITVINNITIFLNMTLLFVLLFYVYPMKFLVNLTMTQDRINTNDLASLFSIYSTGFALVFLFVTLLYKYSYKIEQKPALQYYSNHYLIFVIVALLSVIMAQLKIGISYGLPGFVYPLLGPLCYWHGKKFGVNIDEG